MVRWPRVLTPTHLTQILKSQKNPSTALELFHGAKSRYPNYRHNGPVYAAMISLLGTSNKILEMKEVINLMRNDSCECKDSVFVTAIECFARAGMANECVSLFRRIPSFNCVEKTRSFDILLGILLGRGDLEAAYSVFVENSSWWEVKERVVSLNLLMGSFCRWNRSDLAFGVFQEMDFLGCCPDRETYRILMKGLCEDGRLDAATCLLHSMFWRISTKGNGKDVVVYRILLDALCDSGRVDEALDVLEKVLRKGLRAPRRNHRRLDLSQCCNEKDVEAVKCLINEALVRGVAPGPNTYTSIAVDLYREGKISQADIVLGQALSGGFRPSLITYEAKLAALCKDCRIREAVLVMEVEMVEANYVPTVRMYNILLKGLCDSGDSAAAVGYLRKMAKQIGCVPNHETYSILVHGLCQDCKFVEASQLLEEMLKRSHWPPADVFNAVIRGLCSIGRQYEAVMWLEEMISQDKLPEPCVWNSLLQSSCPNVVGVGMLEQLCS